MSTAFQSITALLLQDTDILQFHFRNVSRNDPQSYQNLCDDRRVLEALGAALPNQVIAPQSEITSGAFCIYYLFLVCLLFTLVVEIVDEIHGMSIMIIDSVFSQPRLEVQKLHYLITETALVQIAVHIRLTRRQRNGCSGEGQYVRRLVKCKTGLESEELPIFLKFTFGLSAL